MGARAVPALPLSELDLGLVIGESPGVYDIQFALENRFKDAIVASFGNEFSEIDPMIRAAKESKFGDFQANCAMALAKRLSKSPRDVAQQIVDALKLEGTAEKLEIAGPGFINIFLTNDVVKSAVQEWRQTDKFGVACPVVQTVVVDYSSPNLAKEMHIGHLRSTIIGDCIARVLEYQGHHVIRQNHLGDWGTQFGMLLENLIDLGWEKTDDQKIGDLNTLYQDAKKRFDTDEEFAARARQRVVALQAGDEQSLHYWKQLIGESARHMNEVFGTLGVGLQDEDIRPESFYNPFLHGVVEDLRSAGELTLDDGAQVVFPAGFVDREGGPLPLIVQKSDGGFGYAATDLAAARYRVNELKATRLIYVVDSRQAGHFGMVFTTLKQAKWVTEAIALDYVPFGTILGKDKKPFKTREGGTVRLVEVLEEAISRAFDAVAQKDETLSTEQRQEIAQAVGIGAVKYADLSNDRVKDYVFDWERMLSLEGNTAVYSQYAYARARSIQRRVLAQTAGQAATFGGFQIETAEERALMLALLQFPRVVEAVAQSLHPHLLCTYAYDLASSFHQFHHSSQVLKAEPELQASRLELIELCCNTLQQCLSLLGIKTVEQM